MTDYLKIDEQGTYTIVTVLQSCGVRSSEDGTTWYDILKDAQPDTKFYDWSAPEGKRRNYGVVANGNLIQSYWHEEAAYAFATVMGQWFGE